MSDIRQLLRRVGIQWESVEQLHAAGQQWLPILKRQGLLKDDDRVLDYGAGLGRLAVPLMNAGLDITAADECPRMRQFLDWRNIPTLTPQQVPQIGRRYDVAMCCFVLQHNPWDAARDIVARLGVAARRLVFTVPTVSQWRMMGRDVPESYVNPAAITDRAVGHREEMSALYSDDDVRALFAGSRWDVSTLRRVDGMHGATWTIERNARPNIVLWAPGHSGTTVACKLLETLGWELPTCDAEFAEPVWIRDYNEKCWSDPESTWDKATAVRLLDQFDRAASGPWVLKEPRLCNLWPWWDGLLAEYRPTLLYLQRPLADIQRSYAKRQKQRDEPRSRGRSIEDLVTYCQQVYEDHTGPKLRLPLEAIAGAVRLFQPERAGL